jgi:trans-aconitate 2-methyltransferase
MNAPDWSAAQYLKFEDERTRPARDLLSRVPLASARVVADLGCGPGNSTELLAGRYPGAAITGVDTSPDMLAAARQRLPSASFVQADVATWAPPADCDLVYANALFQWVPDQLDVLARILGAMKPGAVLALQVPDNLGEPSHVLMREVAGEGPWSAKFATPIAREKIPPVDDYYDRLGAFGAVDIWRTTYIHPLAGPDAIVEMIRSTGLRPFLARLAPEEQAPWLAAYAAKVAAAYPARADGRVLFRFPRLFVVAARR